MAKIGDNYIINQNDINKIKKIHCTFGLDKSSYISNMDNFAFSEPAKEGENKDLLYPRKPVYKFNPITNTKTLLQLPPYIFPKWSNFSENLFVLSNTKNGLKRKGGLFSEFVNKNFDKLKVINDDIKKRLKQKQKEEMKEFFYGINKSNSERNFYSRIPGSLQTSHLTISGFPKSKYRNSLLYEKMKQLQLKTKSNKNIFKSKKIGN